MERARKHEGERDAAGQASAEAATALELLVHGVGGTTPDEMLGDPRAVRITGDDTAAVYRRADDADAERQPGNRHGRPVPEAYVWCNLTSGNATRALWLLLLPFMVANLAHWMRPTTRDRPLTIRLYGLIVRLIGLTLTVLLVAAACEVAMDLAAWQCAGARACARRHAWLGFLTPAGSDGGWWSAPGRRLALAALVPTALTGLLWYLSHRTWCAYESQRPIPRPPEPDEQSRRPALGRPGFWYGRRLVARLRAAHTAAGFLTVAAALTVSAAHGDHRHGEVALRSLGLLLQAALVALAVLVVAVVCRRGRTESRLDQQLDRAVVRLLPAGALALLAVAMVYAGWSRPGRRSEGRLPGASAFGALTLAQGLLVLALGVVAHVLYRAHPDTRTAVRGLAGPAVALLACALGGVMSGGVAQRVADWLDGTGHSLDGPPVLLTWQASTIPPLLLVLLGLAGRLARGTWLLRRAEAAEVERDHPGEPTDTARTLRIAGTRAMATLTDRAPLVVGVMSAMTLLLGTVALVGASATDDTPAGAAHAAPPSSGAPPRPRRRSAPG
ncbi:hypothetical protein GCM10010448_33070 [Streptomyces glomeratus]|uniref:Integral membrane protein n=1 Tax=Streptomyces glomeratus TaxID=284452 RepID=A0ABP6LN16_9ACTN